MNPTRNRTGWTVVLITCLLLAGGCAGGDGGDRTPSAGSSSTTPDSGSGTPTGTPTSQAPTEDADVADGPLLKHEMLSLRLFRGGDWSLPDPGRGSKFAGGTLPAPELPYPVSVAVRGVLGEGPATLEEFLAAERQIHRWAGRKLKRLPDREVGGVDAWVLTRRTNTEGTKRTTYETGGLISTGAFVITVEYPTEWADAEQEIEAMLATVEFEE